MWTHVSGEIVERRPVTFYQQVPVGGVQQWHSFEKQIAWVVSSRTRSELWHGGHKIDAQESSEFNDWYGYLTSTRFDNGRHVRLAERLGINQQSTLELKLITTIVLEPYIEDGKCREWNATAAELGKRYKLIEVPREYGIPYKDDLGGGIETYYKPLDRVAVVEETIWSSQYGEEDNLQRTDAFVSYWRSITDRQKDIKLCIDAACLGQAIGVEA